MPRSITGPVGNAFLDPGGFRPAIFVQMQFRGTGSSPPIIEVCLWSGVGDFEWNDRTWSGIGSLLAIDPLIEDGSTVEARGISITLSGLDPLLLPNALTEIELGLPVTVWLGALSIYGTMILNPVILWSGGIDQPTVDISGDTASLTIACESILVGMNNAIDRRYTLEDQQMDHPGDLGFMFVNALQEQTLYWGVAANKTNTI